uniref:Uncharacterized protein n=1 Tax=Arundo donax TaxID=35708 RepID=A0A0A9FNN8_ARUDO
MPHSYYAMISPCQLDALGHQVD